MSSTFQNNLVGDGGRKSCGSPICTVAALLLCKKKIKIQSI